MRLQLLCAALAALLPLCLSTTIEGSGSPMREEGDTVESKVAAGYGPDDEDAVEGSGTPTSDSGDRIEGSGSVPSAVDITPLLVTSAPSLSTTSTTTPFPIIRIEERTTSQVPSSSPTVAAPPIQSFSTKRPPSTTDSSIPFHNMLKPGIFAAVVGGTVVGFLMAILLVMFIVYRMRKRDEGSYALEEPKQRPYAGYAYTKASSTKEFYA